MLVERQLFAEETCTHQKVQGSVWLGTEVLGGKWESAVCLSASLKPMAISGSNSRERELEHRIKQARFKPLVFTSYMTLINNNNNSIYGPLITGQSPILRILHILSHSVLTTLSGCFLLQMKTLRIRGREAVSFAQGHTFSK